MVQWLRLCASTAGGTGSIPDGRTKILHAEQRGHFFFKKKEGQKKCVGKGDQGRPTWSSAKGFHGKDFKCEEGKE